MLYFQITNVRIKDRFNLVEITAMGQIATNWKLFFFGIGKIKKSWLKHKRW